MPGFREGELILSSAPYAYVLKDDDRCQFCDYCFQENDKLKRCAQCSYLYYCDKQCQMKAWEMHKMECKFLKRAGSNKPPAMTRLFALVLMKIKKYGYDEPVEIVGDRKVSLASLMSHAEENKLLRGDMIEVFLTELKSYIGSDHVPPHAEFAEIFGKIYTNVFKIDHDEGAKGTGLYLGASVFDHSCDPDAAYIFDGTTLNVRMMRSLPHREIKQVHVSYFNKVSLKEERQMNLCYSKFFWCKCSMCSSSKTDDLLTKLVDDTPEMKGKALKCKEDLEDMLRFGPTLKEPQLLYDRCNRLLKLQSGVLADTNVYKIRTLEEAFSACLEVKKYDDAVKIASYLEKPYRMYYSTNHPSLGYFLYEYGKSLCCLQRYSEAISKLSEAESKLKVIYGEHHPTLKIINDFMQRCLEQ